jgi:hypothetical protein
MNLTNQQLPIANSLAGLALAESLVPRSFKPLPETSVASLERDQPLSVRVVRVVEPAIIRDLRAMREEERNTETPITLRAFSDAKDLLNFAHLVLNDLPRTLLVPDSDGGIRIEWARDDRSVRVIIPPRAEQPAYIYQRIGRNSDVKPFSKSLVIQTLRSIILAP